MWRGLRKALLDSVDLLLPPACLLCGQLLPTNHCTHAFCLDCTAAMSPLSPAHCRRCAQPFPSATSNHLCGTCLQRPPTFSSVHTAGLYKGSIKTAIHKLKYRNQLTLAKPLGEFLGKAIATAEDSFIPDIIVPVPLHQDRLRQRGYNQALEVARPLSRQLQIKLDTTLLQRVLKTPPQQGLTARERRSNLRNAFALTAQAPGLKILLVDDVMTTGETVRECCRMLLKGGVVEVQVAVIGRA
jgi:ComF family protein